MDTAKRREKGMVERVGYFMTFFIKTFLLVNFVVGSIIYIFVPNSVSPVPNPATMFLIAVVSGALACVEMFRER
jgi:hypothetical protein